MLNISKTQSYFHCLSSLQLFLFILCYCQMIQTGAKSHCPRSQKSLKLTHREYKAQKHVCFLFVYILPVVNGSQEPCLRKKNFQTLEYLRKLQEMKMIIDSRNFNGKCTPLQCILLYPGMSCSRILICFLLYHEFLCIL